MVWKQDYLNCSNKVDRDGRGSRIIGQGTSLTSTLDGRAENRYNVAPRQRAAVIHRDSEDQNGGAMIEEM